MTIKDDIHEEYIQTFPLVTNLPDQRHAVVVGARDGNIGAEIGYTLNDEGWNVTLTNLEGCDASKQSDVVELLEENKPDTLICCTGWVHLDWIENFPTIEMELIIRNNLLAPIMLTREFVRFTVHTDYIKHIVYIGSMAYRKVLNASSVYCATKAGLAHFAQCMAWELTPKGYRVYCVHPGNVEDTPMTRKTIEGIARYRNIPDFDAKEYWASSKLLDKWLQPEDIANVVSWLVSGQAEHLTGANLDMAGGLR
jgi:NAD(P)-dependent dehydrogenase (short-subunit alcohol dehydrogenase family)